MNKNFITLSTIKLKATHSIDAQYISNKKKFINKIMGNPATNLKWLEQASIFYSKFLQTNNIVFLNNALLLITKCEIVNNHSNIIEPKLVKLSKQVKAAFLTFYQKFLKKGINYVEKADVEEFDINVFKKAISIYHEIANNELLLTKANNAFTAITVYNKLLHYSKPCAYPGLSYLSKLEHFLLTNLKKMAGYSNLLEKVSIKLRKFLERNAKILRQKQNQELNREKPSLTSINLIINDLKKIKHGFKFLLTGITEFELTSFDFSVKTLNDFYLNRYIFFKNLHLEILSSSKVPAPDELHNLLLEIEKLPNCTVNFIEFNPSIELIQHLLAKTLAEYYKDTTDEYYEVFEHIKNVNNLKHKTEQLKHFLSHLKNKISKSSKNIELLKLADLVNKELDFKPLDKKLFLPKTKKNKAYLKIVFRKLNKTIFIFNQSKINIGSSPKNEIVLPYSWVNKKHCFIDLTKKQIIAANSTSGIFADDSKQSCIDLTKISSFKISNKIEFYIKHIGFAYLIMPSKVYFNTLNKNDLNSEYLLFTSLSSIFICPETGELGGFEDETKIKITPKSNSFVLEFLKNQQKATLRKDFTVFDTNGLIFEYIELQGKD